mmetsp:Transcript_1702/g.3059  ORF Transcript_1702/g.3059 Transcript_1702/m.3059 type:complete len:257 (+) Transcript_1702:857-1627(+)
MLTFLFWNLCPMQALLLWIFFADSFSAAASPSLLSGLVALSRTAAFFFFFLGGVDLSSDLEDFSSDFLDLSSDFLGLSPDFLDLSSDFLAFPPFFLVSVLPSSLAFFSFGFFGSFFLAPGAAALTLIFFFLTVLDLAPVALSDLSALVFLLYARFFTFFFLAVNEKSFSPFHPSAISKSPKLTKNPSSKSESAPPSSERSSASDCFSSSSIPAPSNSIPFSSPFSVVLFSRSRFSNLRLRASFSICVIPYALDAIT